MAIIHNSSLIPLSSWALHLHLKSGYASLTEMLIKINAYFWKLSMLHRITKPCNGCSHLLWSAKEKDHSMSSHPTRLFSISENSIQQTHLCHLDSFPSIIFSTRSTTQTVLSFRFQKLPCPIPLRSHCVKWESARRERGVVQRGNTEDISITHISAPWPVSHPFKRATTAARASDTSWTGTWH